MKAARSRPTMRLSMFIQQHREDIVEEWVAFARTLKPWAKGLTRKNLRDHADELLKAIVSDMESSEGRQQQSDTSKGRGAEDTLSLVGKKHAIDRLEGGLRLDQLVSEYRALRASVLRRWEASEGARHGDMTRFNEAIDETLAASTVWYTERMVHTREQFLDILGHDLRNPLASILVGATLLTKSDSLNVKEVGVATRILNSAGRMNRMVSDLLDLTRTRLGSGIPVTPKPMDLRSLCQQVMAEFEAIHPDRTLQCEAQGDLHGEWDSDRLAQVLSNLVANALQYGCEGGAVNLMARAKGSEVVLRVHNKGPLMSEGAMKTIFEPMARQRPDDRDKHPTGLGLGLYIAREVVTAHGGTIGVTSLENEGTTFTVQLPRHPQRHSRPSD